MPAVDRVVGGPPGDQLSQRLARGRHVAVAERRSDPLVELALGLAHPVRGRPTGRRRRGLAHFPGSEVVASRVDYEYSRGALGRVRGFLPRTGARRSRRRWSSMPPPPFGPFARSTPLTAAADVTCCPLRDTRLDTSRSHSRTATPSRGWPAGTSCRAERSRPAPDGPTTGRARLAGDLARRLHISEVAERVSPS